ncbi:MAG: PfkB family carbohydrate kinase [Gaiellaceae bacterium]
MPDLVAIGEIMLDVEAPPLVDGAAVHGAVRVRAGGTAVNAALAARAIGASAAVVGRIGADAAGRIVREELAAAGVEAWLVEDPALPTGTFLEAGEAVAADRGASGALAPGDLPERIEAGVVIVSVYAPEPVARAAVRQAEAEWVLGPCGNAYVGPERPTNGYRLVCVTAGPEGATAWLDGAEEHRRPDERVPGRATGAGDALAAGLLLGLGRGLPLGDALELGCELGLAAARRRDRTLGPRP